MPLQEFFTRRSPIRQQEPPEEAWNRHAREYLDVVDGLNQKDGKGRLLREQVLLPALLDKLPYIQGQTVLDAATGEGSIARLLLRRGVKQVVGVDISPLIAKEAKKRSGSNEDVVIANLNIRPPYILNREEKPRALPFKNDAFDLVLCSLTAMWLPNIQGLGPEFARVAKPGACVLVSILNPKVNQGFVDSNTGVIFKRIDKTAGPFPYFLRTVRGYENTLQRKPSPTEEYPRLKLEDTDYVTPSFKSILQYPRLLAKRVIQPEFVIFELRVVKPAS